MMLGLLVGGGMSFVPIENNLSEYNAESMQFKI